MSCYSGPQFEHQFQVQSVYPVHQSVTQRGYNDGNEIDGKVGVFLNVVNILAVLLNLAMVISGSVWHGECPVQPVLAYILIAKGIASLTLPGIFFVKLCRNRPEKRQTFYTIYLTFFILSFGMLLAVTGWLGGANCSETNLHKASVGLVVIDWFFHFGSAVVCIVMVCKRGACCEQMFDQEE